MANPFRNIFRLSLGDFFAKAISFFVFIYLARTLGVQAYGVLEFALSFLVYMLLLCDAGLELWGTRQVARGQDPAHLAARIIAIRLIFAVVAFLGLGLALSLSVFPAFPQLRLLLAIFGLALFAQAIDLRWVFMGQEKMQHVGTGLVVAQLIFAAATFMLVRGPSDVLWIPLFQFFGNLSMALYLLYQFVKAGNRLPFRFTLSGVRPMFAPALTLGMSRGLALLSYNFDTLLLGFLVGSAAVGWYSAAYRPVTVFLAISTTFYLGLFPVLSRAYNENLDTFLEVVKSSLRLAAALAIPVGVGGVFLAQPLIALLYGETYRDSGPVLQILGWSAALVFLRGTFRQALCAAGYQGQDLRIAALATGINVALNFALIPIYGMIGAALATVASEIAWLILGARTFASHVKPSGLLPLLAGPLLSGAGMTICFLITGTWTWPYQAVLGVMVYFGLLAAIERKRLFSRLRA